VIYIIGHFIGDNDAAVNMRYDAKPSRALCAFFFWLGSANRTAYYEISLAFYFIHVPIVDLIELCEWSLLTLLE
jgi:hypothetical protein